MNQGLKRFAMRLKKLRHQQGLTQEALAKKLGMSRPHLARLEDGQHDPSLSTVVKLAKALKVTVAELVE